MTLCWERRVAGGYWQPDSRLRDPARIEARRYWIYPRDGTPAVEFAHVVVGAGSGGTSDNVPVMVAVERVDSNRSGRICLQVANAHGAVQLVDLAASVVPLPHSQHSTPNPSWLAVGLSRIEVRVVGASIEQCEGHVSLGIAVSEVVAGEDARLSPDDVDGGRTQMPAAT